MANRDYMFGRTATATMRSIYLKNAMRDAIINTQMNRPDQLPGLANQFTYENADKQKPVQQDEYQVDGGQASYLRTEFQGASHTDKGKKPLVEQGKSSEYIAPLIGTPVGGIEDDYGNKRV